MLGVSDHPSASGRVYSFGRFQLAPDQRLLLCDGAIKPLRSRELDLLTVLVQRAGEFIGKDELIAAVWPTTTVSEANLRVQVGALRRVLADGYDGARFIVSVVGRGYCFLAPVTVSDGAPRTPSPSATPLEAAPSGSSRLPSRLSRMVGRAEVVEKLSAHLQTRRLVTIVGAGGIGKTTLALALAEMMAPNYPHGAHFIDLTTLDDSAVIGAKLARELSLETVAIDPAESALDYLRDKQILLVFDNCEHVIESIAALADAILRSAPRATLLATSREPLRIEGEWVHRLSSLDTPPRFATIKAAEAMAYPAVQLFAERASSSQDTFQLGDADAPAVAEICRRLDGLPLALELAAAHVGPFGVRNLADRLSDSLSVLKNGRRTAIARHQALRATLDWSYELLGERERTAFRRLSRFAHGFTLEAACAVASGGTIDEEDLIDAVYELSAKSLVESESIRGRPRYRFLETTRSYAQAKLAAAPDSQDTARRHAEYCLVLLSHAEQDWQSETRADWLSMYGAWIDDVRAAIDWCYAEGDEMSLGIELTARSAPLAHRLALAREYIGRIDMALENLARMPGPQSGLEVRLRGELVSVVMHTLGDVDRMRQSEARVAVLAEHFKDTEAQLDLLGVLYGHAFNRADWRAALDRARTALTITSTLSDTGRRAQADRMMAQALHFNGDHPASRIYAEKVLARADEELPGTFRSHTQVDVRIGAQIVLARGLWLQGYADQAWRVMKRCLELAGEIGGFTYCYSLAFAAVPIAIWSGDLMFAQGAVALLAETAARHSLQMWRQWAQDLSKVLRLRADPNGRLEFHWANYDNPQLRELQLDEFAALDSRLVNARALARAEAGPIAWCTPELLRGAAETRLEQGLIVAGKAESMLARALEIARSHDALAWELRIVLSLARLWRRENRAESGAAMVRSTLARFREGFDTADLRQALDFAGPA